MICHYAFGINNYEQIREHIKALKSQEYLIGVVIIDMQVTAGHIPGSAPSPGLVSDITQFVFEQGGPVAHLYYYDQITAPLMTVSPVNGLIPEPVSRSTRYLASARWLTCPTNTMVRTIHFMQKYGVTHLLVTGSNHNGAIEYMAQEAFFNGMHVLTFTPLIAGTTLMQHTIHAQLSGLFKDHPLYTGVNLDCTPDRNDDLRNRTARRQPPYIQADMESTSLFE